MQEIEFRDRTVREFFTGKTDEELKRKMKSRLDELMAQHGEPVKVTHRKLGRNEPCFCGSGVKFKKCCLPKSR